MQEQRPAQIGQRTPVAGVAHRVQRLVLLLGQRDEPPGRGGGQGQAAALEQHLRQDVGLGVSGQPGRPARRGQHRRDVRGGRVRNPRRRGRTGRLGMGLEVRAEQPGGGQRTAPSQVQVSAQVLGEDQDVLGRREMIIHGGSP